jgi:hypothetical protein
MEELEMRCMPAIRLDLVALHEFGHALGLEHSSNPASIMYAYYNPNYNLANFASDPAVSQFQAIYANPDSSPWKDNLDGADDGVVNVSYSFTPDGVKMDSGKRNALFSTMDRIFGEGNWQSIFTGELARWASVSNGNVAFVERADGPYAFNVSGLAQNDPRFGDIRIGAHRFDNAGRVLAHTYFPPPNGATAAGDAHFDQAEDWSLSGALSAGEGRGGGGGGNLTLGAQLPATALPVDPASQLKLNVTQPVVVPAVPTVTRIAVRPGGDELPRQNRDSIAPETSLLLDAESQPVVDSFAVLSGTEG